MRVIAGQYRSRPLQSLSDSTCVHSDRLRETLFDVLPRSWFTGQRLARSLRRDGRGRHRSVQPRRASGIFCGIGKETCPVAAGELGALGIDSGFEVHEREVSKALPLLESTGVVCDFCFLDPPYRRRGSYGQVLGYLSQSLLLQPASVVAAEHEKKFDPGERFGALLRYRRLDQGDASLSFYRLR